MSMLMGDIATHGRIQQISVLQKVGILLIYVFTENSSPELYEGDSPLFMSRKCAAEHCCSFARLSLTVVRLEFLIQETD